MTFDEVGHLTPYTVIETDLQTFEQMFVLNFSELSKRKKWYLNYLEYVKNLKETIEIDFLQWVDGSFTTLKFNPNDIDFLTFLDFETYEQFDKEVNEFKGRRYSQLQGTDGYFIKVYPPQHRLYRLYELEYKRWIFDFSTNYKNNKSKGFVALKF